MHFDTCVTGRTRMRAALAGRRTIGIVRLELAPPRFCFVSELVILGAHRGRGVGEWFMAQVERLCLERGIDRVVLRPHGDSHGFYAKLRFEADPLVAGFLKKDVNPLRRKPALPYGLGVTAR